MMDELRCPFCKEPIPDAPMECPHCGRDLSNVMLEVECPNCEESNSTARTHCRKCGASLENLKKTVHHLHNDPQIKQLNEKYAKCNLWRILSLIGVILSVMALMMYDQYNWPDLFCAVGILGIPAFGISWLVNSVRRKMLDRKIRQMLEAKS